MIGAYEFSIIKRTLDKYGVTAQEEARIRALFEKSISDEKPKPTCLYRRIREGLDKKRYYYQAECGYRTESTPLAWTFCPVCGKTIRKPI